MKKKLPILALCFSQAIFAADQRSVFDEMDAETKAKVGKSMAQCFATLAIARALNKKDYDVKDVIDIRDYMYFAGVKVIGLNEFLRIEEGVSTPMAHRMGELKALARNFPSEYGLKFEKEKAEIEITADKCIKNFKDIKKVDDEVRQMQPK